MSDIRPTDAEMEVAAELTEEELAALAESAVASIDIPAIWTSYRTRALQDLALLLADQDPDLTVDMGFYPNTGCRIDMEQWDENRIVYALNLAVILTNRGDYARFVSIVNDLKVKAKEHGTESSALFGAMLTVLEWGDFLR